MEQANPDSGVVDPLEHCWLERDRARPRRQPPTDEPPRGPAEAAERQAPGRDPRQNGTSGISLASPHSAGQPRPPKGARRVDATGSSGGLLAASFRSPPAGNGPGQVGRAADHHRAKRGDPRLPVVQGLRVLSPRPAPSEARGPRAQGRSAAAIPQHPKPRVGGIWAHASRPGPGGPNAGPPGASSLRALPALALQVSRVRKQQAPAHPVPRPQALYATVGSELYRSSLPSCPCARAGRARDPPRGWAP